MAIFSFFGRAKITDFRQFLLESVTDEAEKSNYSNLDTSKVLQELLSPFYIGCKILYCVVENLRNFCNI